MNIESYPSEYLDINFLTQTLYNFMHTTEVKKYLPEIDYKNIDITDIKLLLPIPQQTALINNIFNTDIKFVYRHAGVYVFKRTNNVLSTDIALQLYSSEKDSMIAPDNANSLITWILSDLVIKGICNNILLNVMTVDLKLSLLRPFIKLHRELISFDDNKDDEIIKCTISEHFYKKHKLNSIVDSLKENEIKSVIFQIMTAIAIIQESYIGFRHNMLIADNIQLYKKKPSNRQVTLNAKTITFNDYGYEVKITNFDKSIIIGLTDNDALLPEHKKIDITYDIITFLEDIQEINIIDVKKLISKIKIKKYTENKISLTNIIMTEYLDLASGKIVQAGGSKSKKSEKSKKPRTYKGVRYENDNGEKEDYSSKYSSKYDDLPDSLSSLDDSEYNTRSSKNYNSGMMQQPMNNMSIPAQNMSMPAQSMPMPAQSMPMPMNGMNMPMNGMSMPMNGMSMPAQQPMNGMSMPVDERQLNGMGLQQEIAKFMPPSGNNMAMTSANLRGGASQNWQNMGEPNFFF
jgi:hypothetical protein